MQKTSENNHQKIIRLTECAVMLALSIVLSFVEVWKMPMGGGITLLSMLPVCLIAVKYGTKAGLSTAFLFGAFHLFKGLASGDVFVYCATAFAVAVCVLFDYLVPFSALGLSGIFRKKGTPGVCAGITLGIFIRFLCHFITGVVIWAQFAPEGQSKFVYSLLYNGQYMLPECVITVAGAVILLRIPRVRALIGMASAKETESK